MDEFLAVNGPGPEYEALRRISVAARSKPEREIVDLDLAVWAGSPDVVEIQGDTGCVVAVQSGVVIGPVG